MNRVTLGILGGLGPMSGILFCEMLTEHTKADCDQDHLNFLLSSRADTPDRTAFILGQSEDNPTSVMIDEVKKLVSAGADMIAIPCNTAHYFYESIADASDVPVINIIHKTVDFCRFCEYTKVGVISTGGTAASGAYKDVIESAGIEYDTCTPEEQQIITDIIYNEIKRGKRPNVEKFMSVANAMRERGAQAIVLGCTELSILKRNYELGDGFVDSLEVLAATAIRLLGKEPVGFESSLMNFTPRKEDIYVT